jgi:hypothetical protein
MVRLHMIGLIVVGGIQIIAIRSTGAISVGRISIAMASSSTMVIGGGGVAMSALTIICSGSLGRGFRFLFGR